MTHSISFVFGDTLSMTMFRAPAKSFDLLHVHKTYFSKHYTLDCPSQLLKAFQASELLREPYCVRKRTDGRLLMRAPGI